MSNKILVLALFVFCQFSVSVYAEVPAHEFIGAKKCSICHKKPEEGEQYGIWLNTSHAKAFENLGTQAAKDAGAKLGVADPQSSGKCLKCHSTAYWFSDNKVSDTIPVEEGVSCESCHGPGKDYMKKSIMENREEAIAHGMMVGDESTCLKCHNQESPTYKPFDYKERFEKIKHPVPD